jgi:hypothetical protein
VDGEDVALDVLAIAGWAGLGLLLGAVASIVLSVTGGTPGCAD